MPLFQSLGQSHSVALQVSFNQQNVQETSVCLQASTQGMVQELLRRGEAAGAKVLCPVPHVTGGLTEPQVVPRFLASLQVGTPSSHPPLNVKLESVSHRASILSCRSPFSWVHQHPRASISVSASCWAGQACMWLPGKAAGAEAVRVDAYETRPGCLQADCIPEMQMLAEGSIHALAFTSTAEVGCLSQRTPFQGSSQIARLAIKLMLVVLTSAMMAGDGRWRTWVPMHAGRGPGACCRRQGSPK